LDTLNLGDAVKSRTVQVAILKVDRENPVPSILLTHEKQKQVDDKPAGWGMPGGGEEARDPDIIETARRELEDETRRVMSRKDLEAAFRWSTLKPSRTVKGAVHEDIVLLLIVTEAPKVVIDFIREADEIADARWFRLDRLPDARWGHGMYESHRMKLAKTLRAAGEAVPKMFARHGLDAERLAAMVEPRKPAHRR
jgi:8-oxo-dGTP pyrophosphatase MutT (NUDIX family)